MMGVLWLLRLLSNLDVLLSQNVFHFLHTTASVQYFSEAIASITYGAIYYQYNKLPNWTKPAFLIRENYLQVVWPTTFTFNPNPN